MKYIFTTIFMLLFNLAICQDTYLVKCTTNTDAVLGQISISGCGLSVDEILKPNTEIILYGYISCNEKSEFYRVFYNDIYFIKKSEVNISPKDETYLKTLTRQQDLTLSQEVSMISRKNQDSIKKMAETMMLKYREIGIKNGLLIKQSAVFDHNEYTDGTGYTFTPINASKKTIKYIWVTVKGINPVNDVVSSKTLKCVGPIETNDQGTYSFDYVWFTDVVVSCKIASIKIQYMDGSIKQLNNAESLILPDYLYDIMYSSE
jgi:hypothetical protein